MILILGSGENQKGLERLLIDENKYSASHVTFTQSHMKHFLFNSARQRGGKGSCSINSFSFER